MRRLCSLVLAMLLVTLTLPITLAGSAAAAPNPPGHNDDLPQAP